MTAPPPITHEMLMRRIVPARIPESENWRRTWGRAMSPASVEVAIRNAEAGCMGELTDLEYESLRLDPHASSVLVKRFGSTASLDWQVTPAKGPGINRDLAEELAEFVRGQLTGVEELEERFYDLAWAEFWGRSACELHWRMEYGPRPWRLAELGWIHPRRLWFGPERELRLVDTWRATANFSPQGFALRDARHKFISWAPRLFSGYQEQEGLGPRFLYWLFFKRFSWRMRMKLTELFGLPWRIVEADKDKPPHRDAMAQARDEIAQLGDDNTAVMPPGLSLDVVFPGEGSADIFKMTNDDVDAQISKLALGNTGTMDGAEANRASSIVQRSEQDVLIGRDATALSGRIQRYMVRPIVELNWGPSVLDHAPQFWLRSQPPRDVTKELQNVSAVVGLGLPVSEGQVRELSGLHAPEPGENAVTQTVIGPGSNVVDISKNAAPDGMEDAGVEGAEVRALRDLVPQLTRLLERLDARGQEGPQRPFPADGSR